MVHNFQEFCEELIKSGFSMGGGNAKGIYAVIPFDWKSSIPDCPIQWHTGNPETDPWEWRMRVLEERKDIAYGKVFFGTSGYITKEWYPYFLAVRRQGMVFEEWYDEGKISLLEKKIYEAISENGQMALHELKSSCGITKETASKFDRALTNLQKYLFVTMCGRTQKKNKYGEGYGWNSTVFCTVEDFWGEELSIDISSEEAYKKIHDRILELNPDAEEKAIRKFIL
ncbi:MAG: hypothetical protein IJN16_11545 [Lachnospiraceae bacterium]|nr:hypothetical protein [Lachnospiraceae bacterium]